MTPKKELDLVDGIKAGIKLLIVLGSLGLIGYGLWLVHPAAGFLGVGALLWIDMLLWSLRR